MTSMSCLEAVPEPRGIRRLAFVMALIVLLLPFVLTLVPWVQNVPGAGRVTAMDPIDRTQIIPAPVTGRLVRLEVQEGQYVREGQLLAELADQDPLYSARLEQQSVFARQKLDAARLQVLNYDSQLEHLVEARELALTTANYELKEAIEKVRAAEQEMQGLEASYEQKFLDRERKWKLYQEKLVSELDLQKAEADSLSGLAKVEEAKAKVEQARNAELAKMASMGKTGSDLAAKIESAKSSREESRAKVSLAEKELTEALTKFDRQKTQTVVAPRTGWVLRVYAAGSADLVKQGDPLIEFIPETDELVVELWVRGVDAPLMSRGRKVRLQFEGWPAVQFAGWPSVAVGTFGGEVVVVDAQAGADGRFRALVRPDPDDAPWRRIVRAGQGWVLLDTVSLGYEFWRQLNAFPPTVAVSDTSGKPAAKQGSAFDGKEKEQP